MTRVGATALGAESFELPLPTPLAITTAKYGRKIAPAKQTHINQPWTTMASTIQTTRTVIAIVYLIMRDLRSSSGDWPIDVTLWAFATEVISHRIAILKD
jgi:hypothetical protein